MCDISNANKHTFYLIYDECSYQKTFRTQMFISQDSCQQMTRYEKKKDSSNNRK